LLASVAWGIAIEQAHCNTLQHTATHCNTLQHTATQCTPQHTATQQLPLVASICSWCVCACVASFGRHTSLLKTTGLKGLEFWLQCVAVWCSVCCIVVQCGAVLLQCVAEDERPQRPEVCLQCVVAVWCSVCCSVLRCCCSVLHKMRGPKGLKVAGCSMLRCSAVCCSVEAVCCTR